MITRAENNEAALEDLDLYALNLGWCVFIVYSFWQAEGHLENPMLLGLGESMMQGIGKKMEATSIPSLLSLTLSWPSVDERANLSSHWVFDWRRKRINEGTEGRADQTAARQNNGMPNIIKKGSEIGLQAGSLRDKAASVWEDNLQWNGLGSRWCPFQENHTYHLLGDIQNQIEPDWTKMSRDIYHQS